MNWEDLRYVLAIARGKTLTAAARNLKVNQTTVSRRLKSIEEGIGSTLFLRTGSVMLPTDMCQTVVRHSERVEAEVLRLAQQVDLGAVAPQGLVRISTMPWIVNHVLLPALPQFSGRYPDIEIELMGGNKERSLTRREAEIALRFDIGPRGREVSIPVADVGYAQYGPGGGTDDDLPWVAYGEDIIDELLARWSDATIHASDRIAMRANDAGNIHEAIRNGLGKGLIPEILGNCDPDLQRLSGPEPELVRHLKLLVHPDIQRLGHVETVINWLAKEVGPGLK